MNKAQRTPEHPLMNRRPRHPTDTLSEMRTAVLPVSKDILGMAISAVNRDSVPREPNRFLNTPRPNREVVPLTGATVPSTKDDPTKREFSQLCDWTRLPALKKSLPAGTICKQTTRQRHRYTVLEMIW
ncbi:MAG: hypothetical protein CMJ59_01475 [Planctomycetaceae bacterium]|nr:hypothetical protein [Planctomycetaceae bacterium]